MKKQTIARTYLGTLNNPDVDIIIDYLEKWHSTAKARYVVGQLEKGVEGTPHIQFYLNFEKPIAITALKKHCGKAHFEPVKVDNGAAAYCMKTETRLDGPWEFGTKPVKRNSKEDWEQVWEEAKKGNLEKIDPKIRVAHYHQLK